jgi:hypothetical protein
MMAAFLALLLAEELDWGAVLGWPALGLRIEAVLGHRNLHNSLRGASYLLFALPLALHFAAPARVHGPLAPLRDERAGFFAIAGLFGLYQPRAVGALGAGAARGAAVRAAAGVRVAAGPCVGPVRRASASG